MNNNGIPWTQIVTAIVAVYAACMSTITFLSNKKEKMRRIEVVISNGLLDLTFDLSEIMLLITVRNPGFKNVIINIPYLILPDKRTMVFPRPQSNVTYPHNLEEGSQCILWTDMRELARSLVSNGYTGILEIHAGVEEGSGRKYRSKKPWKLDTSTLRGE